MSIDPSSTMPYPSAADAVAGRHSTRVAIFCWLWAFSVGVGLLMFPSWVLTPLGWLQAISLLVVLARPKWTAGFFAFVLFSTLRGLEKMPFMANHIFFELLLSMTMLLAWCTLAIVRRTTRVDGDAWFDLFAPVMRVMLVILYFFAVLHKLNTDYFNPVISCGSRLFVMLTERFYTWDPPVAIKWMSIVGTLVVEAAIAIGLMLRPTRKATLALAVGFHFVLGLLPHEGLPSFSSMLFALYYLFFPAEFLPTIRRWGEERREQFRAFWAKPGGRPSFVKLGGGIAVLAVIIAVAGYGLLRIDVPFDSNRSSRVVMGFDLNQAQGYLDRVALIVFLVFSIPYLWMFVRCVRQHGMFGGGAIPNLMGRPTWLWAMVVLMLFTGFGPYLGLRTQISYAMFSNLRTEERPNHFFIPEAVKVFSSQQDMVIVMSGLPKDDIRFGPHYQINAVEFRRAYAHAKPGAEVVYIRDGEKFRHRKGDANPPHADLFRPLTMMERKYWNFRPIEVSGPRHCSH